MRLRSAKRRMRKMQWIICLPVVLASACFVLYTTSSSSSSSSSSASSSSSFSSYNKIERESEKQSDVNEAATSANRLKMSPAHQAGDERRKEGRRTQVKLERLPQQSPPQPTPPPSSSSSSSPSQGSESHHVPGPDRYGHYWRRPKKAKMPNNALGQMKFSRQQTVVGVERSRSGVIVSAVGDDDATAAAAADGGDGVRAHSVNEPNSIVFGWVEEEGRRTEDGWKTTADYNGSIQLTATSDEIASRYVPHPRLTRGHPPPRTPPAPPMVPAPLAPSSQDNNHMPTVERNREETMKATRHSMSSSESSFSSSSEPSSSFPSSSSSTDSSSSSTSTASGDRPADANPRGDDLRQGTTRVGGEEAAGDREESEEEREDDKSRDADGSPRDGRRRGNGVTEWKSRPITNRRKRKKMATTTVDEERVHQTDGVDICPDGASRCRCGTSGKVAAGQVTPGSTRDGVASEAPRLGGPETEAEKDSVVTEFPQKRLKNGGLQEKEGDEGDVRPRRALTIPRTIHQTSDFATVPGQAVEWIKSWLRHNPEYEYWFWTDSGTRHVLTEHFPPWIASLYDAYPYAINQADIRKFLILYLHGGVYADLDTECLRPLDSLLDDPDAPGCIMGLEPEIHRLFLYPNDYGRDYVTSSFIACRPKHPFLEFVIRQLPDYFNNSRTLRWNDNILNSTGPTFLTDVVHKYLSDGRDRGPEAGIFIAPSEWLVPTFDPINLDRFKVLCKVKGIVSRDGQGVVPLPKICDKLTSNAFLNVPEAASYTNHHWLHSWGVNFIPHGFIPVETLINLTRLIN